MKKMILSLVIINSLIGCNSFHKQPPPIIPYQITKTPLDLTAYKSLPIIVSESQICMATEDYSKYIQLLNTLKNHITLQETLIQELQKYYTSSLTVDKK
jgi:hypothetical protein